MRNLKRNLYLLLFLVFICGKSLGQPATDIHVADLRIESGQVRIGAPENITKRNGYDNQPFFLSDGSGILYTSIHEDGQADIYLYDLTNNKTRRITETKESEYSPTVMIDGQHFSTVRVEADSSQRLWQFPLTGGEPSLLLHNIKPVGYHAWGSANIVALFVLGSPPSLYLADIKTGNGDKIMGGIGRSLHKIPNANAVSFVHKVTETEWWIKQLDLQDRKIKALIQTLAGSEDYTWTPDGIILMGQGSKLFKWQPGKDKSWVEVTDFEKAGLAGITRLAVSSKGDRIALVSGRRVEE